jgi:hypothetical protein
VANRIELKNALYQKHTAKCLHCGGWHPASYTRRGCKVYQEIVRIKFSSPRTTASIHITNAPGQDNKSPAAPQKTEGRPKMTHPCEQK